jgi:hypothetical protein
MTRTALRKRKVPPQFEFDDNSMAVVATLLDAD